MRNTERVTCNYDGLFAGEVAEPISIVVAASQTIKRGDLLECVVTESVSGANITRTIATSFSKPSAVADIKNIYVIAAADITTETGETGKKVSVYDRGVFNAGAVTFGGASTATQNFLPLLAHGIILKDAQDGTVSAT